MEVRRAKNPKYCSSPKLCKYHPCARHQCKWYQVNKPVDFTEIEKYITNKAHLLIKP